MKILKENITPPSLQVVFTDFTVQAAELGDAAVVLKVLKPPQGSFTLSPLTNDRVRVEGNFSATLEVCCSRCLRPLPLPLQGNLRVIFQPQLQGGDEEVMLSRRDLETYFYDGVELDLSEMLRSEVSLLLPYAPLCAEPCVAVCPACGGSPCRCQREKADPRWNKLAGLKFD